MTGIVKWFNDEKGYGFITYENGEAFVHYSSIRANGHKTLVKDEIVEFDLVNTQRGHRAKNITSIVDKCYNN